MSYRLCTRYRTFEIGLTCNGYIVGAGEAPEHTQHPAGGSSYQDSGPGPGRQCCQLRLPIPGMQIQRPFPGTLSDESTNMTHRFIWPSRFTKG